MQWPFRLSAGQERQAVRNDTGDIIALVLRDKQAVSGTIHLAAERIAPELFRMTVLISNDSPMEDVASLHREHTLPQYHFI